MRGQVKQILKVYILGFATFIQFQAPLLWSPRTTHKSIGQEGS